MDPPLRPRRRGAGERGRGGAGAALLATSSGARRRSCRLRCGAMWRQPTRAGPALAVAGAGTALAPPPASGRAPAGAGAFTALPPAPASAPPPPARPPAPPVAAPSRAAGASIATIVAVTRARATPAGRVVGTAQPQTDWTGEPQSLLVIGSEVRGAQVWLRVLLPIRPDGSSA